MERKELLTAHEAASRLSVTRRTILKWARENRIESIRISKKKILFTQDAIDEFLRSRTNVVESRSVNQNGTGRRIASPNSTKKGGNRRNSGELWNYLRKEVRQWQ